MIDFTYYVGNLTIFLKNEKPSYKHTKISQKVDFFLSESVFC